MEKLNKKGFEFSTLWYFECCLRLSDFQSDSVSVSTAAIQHIWAQPQTDPGRGSERETDIVEQVASSAGL